MKLVCMSDTHNKHTDVDMQGIHGDVLIHAGDFTNYGRIEEIRKFVDWFTRQPFKHKILVAGNHELSLDRKWVNVFQTNEVKRAECHEAVDRLVRNNPAFYYLEDSAVVIDGVKFYGSPRTMEGHIRWSFHYTSEEEARDVWSRIPADTNVLITHIPPIGCLDVYDNHHHGCATLMQCVKDVVRPKVHVFGHVHAQHGILTTRNTLFVNAALVNGSHHIKHRPIMVTICTETETNECGVGSLPKTHES